LKGIPMIKLYELNLQTRDWLSALTDAEVYRVLDMATSVMFEIEMRTPRVHMGANSCVELALKTILYFEQKGNHNGE
jgi:hypothetical protein